MPWPTFEQFRNSFLCNRHPVVYSLRNLTRKGIIKLFYSLPFRSFELTYLQHQLPKIVLHNETNVSTLWFLSSYTCNIFAEYVFTLSANKKIV